MGEREEVVTETKLNILIGDFKRFRRIQEEINTKAVEHSERETRVQENILTTLQWYTIIGSFMVVTISYIILSMLGVK